MKRSFSTKDKLDLCFDAVSEKQAVDPVALKLVGLTTITDYFLVCSGASTRQVQAIADSVEKRLREQGMKRYQMEGYESGTWVLIDVDDVVVHVFRDDTRKFYDLERLWADAPRVPLESGDKSRGTKPGGRRLGSSE
jgi:ribosome-associated protein